MSKTILLACINFLFIIGCSSTKYLQSSVVSDLGSNIKNVQVYVSYSPGNAMLYLVGESPLYRKTVSTSNNRSVVSSGGVKTENDNYTKESEISISFDTPGVIDNYGVGWVNVDFGDDVILKFRVGEDGLYFLDKTGISIKGVSYDCIRCGDYAGGYVLKYARDHKSNFVKEYEHKNVPGKKVK